MKPNINKKTRIWEQIALKYKHAGKYFSLCSSLKEILK